MTTFDDILEEVGNFGPCQMRLFALLCVVSLPFTGLYVGVVFQGFTPEHWCRNPAVTEMRQGCGWSLADTRRLTVPLVNTSGELLHSTCEQYDLDWNATGLTCDTQKLNLSRAGLTACKSLSGQEVDRVLGLDTFDAGKNSLSTHRGEIIAYVMTTFDDMLEEVGTFGPCQKRIFAMLCLVSLPFAGALINVVFQGFTPEHWCRIPAVTEMRQRCGWSLADIRRHTVPLINTSGELLHSTCKQYDLDWNATGLTCDTQKVNQSRAGLMACKGGWEYNYEGRQSIVTEFDLVCADAWVVDMYQASLNIGFLVGGIVTGYLADRYGRKMVFLISNVFNGIAGILVAVAPNYICLLVFRTICGFGVKGGWMVTYVLLTEIVGMEYRRTVGILYQMFFSVGNLILPLLAYYITDWRWLQVAIVAPYFLFLSYYWFIPESPRWLFSQNQSAKAVEITEAMAKENKKKLSTNIETLTDDIADSPTASFMDLIRTPNMRKHTFVLMFNWFTSAVVYQGLIMRVGIVAGGNVYVDFLISGLVEFPAAFLIIFTIERIGRRLPFATANIVAGASCIITAFIPDSMFWLKTAVACIGRLGITMAFEMVVFVNIELYPTSVRNLGVSVCSTLCDVGGIVAPFMLYRLAAIWLELPLIIFGTVALVAGGLVLLLPETRGVPLPETIDDIEFPGRKEDDLKNQRLKNLLQSDLSNDGKEPTAV